MKKTIKLIILIALIFISKENVKANPYAYNFTNEGDTLIKCEYGEKYVIKYEIINYNGEVNLYVDGAKKNKIADNNDKKPTENAMNKKEVTDYIAGEGKCPNFLSIYKKKYVFANTKEDLLENSEIFDLKRTKYNKNYCFYKFEINYFNWTTNQRDIQKLGLFVRPDKFENFANKYEKEECPAAIVTEMEESTKNGSLFKRKFYASETTENQTLIDECNKDALEQVKEIYDGATDSYLCKIAPKQDLTSTAGNDQKENFDPESEEPLGCDALFDQETKKFISMAYFIIEIIAILIAIALTIKDYAVAILNSNADEIKKANKNLITRLIVIIILLLLPSLINLLFKVFNIKAFNSDPLCGTVNK